ncbi:MAG TPA: hypothetical protein VGK50_01705 [Coriobacteriia bacterium]|jgi:hypothetical protein
MKWIPGLVLAGAALYAAIGRELPLVGSGKGAFWTLAILGFAVCAPGIGSAIEGGGFTSPLFVVGAVLGVLAMVLAAAVTTGIRPAFLATDAQLVVAIASIIVLKVAIATANAAVAAAR